MIAAGARHAGPAPPQLTLPQALAALTHNHHATSSLLEPKLATDMFA
jgi:hypothetical protein